MTYFPILITMVVSGEEKIIEKPEDLPSGIAFVIKETKVRRKATKEKNGRKFVPISTLDLETKMYNAIGGEPGVDPLDIFALKDHVVDDMKIRFDLENFEYGSGNDDLVGFRSLDNGFTFLGITSGGDWESPVFWIVYWDGKGLRGYIPTDGNCFNPKTKMALGNGEDEEDEDYLDHDFDWEKIEVDIKARITQRS